MKISKPDSSEYPEWYAHEIDPIQAEDLIPALEDSFSEAWTILRPLGEDVQNYRYAEGKWTLKELWQHVIDVERIISYRALRFSRRDETVLHGFNQDEYVKNSNANERSWEDIMQEYEAVRHATVCLYKSFREDMLMLRGTAGKSVITVRATGYLILGHEIHHLGVVKERYLKI